MSVDRPDDVFAGLRRRGFVVSSWPWRSLAYLITGAPVAGCAAFVLLVVALPWLEAARRAADGDRLTTTLLVLAVGSAVLTAVFILPLSVGVAALERWRLAMVDLRPVASAHRPVPGGPAAWLRARFTETATWREVLYVVLLATVVPTVYGVVALVALTDVALLLSPWLAARHTGPIAAGFAQVTSVRQALPYAAAGFVLLLPAPYVAGLLAAGQATLTRALLSESRRDDTAFREIARSRSRLVDTYEAERRRIERDLHDGAQHQLTSLTLQLAVARLDVSEDSPAGRALANAHGQAKQFMVGLRELIHGIRPQTLTELGLIGALQELAEQSPIPVTVTAPPEGTGRPPERVENAAYFVAAEALANVAKHSAATHTDVTLTRTDDLLILQIRDNGRGGADPGRGRGTGLTGLADRVAALDGRLLLASPAGGPTLLRVELPCER